MVMSGVAEGRWTWRKDCGCDGKRLACNLQGPGALCCTYLSYPQLCASLCAVCVPFVSLVCFQVGVLLVSDLCRGPLQYSNSMSRSSLIPSLTALVLVHVLAQFTLLSSLLCHLFGATYPNSHVLVLQRGWSAVQMFLVEILVLAPLVKMRQK
jgi:hypothetical protein